MASVGEILRRERERQGLSIALVADQTRIRLQFLEALERDDFASIPGQFFARSFTTQYAQRLGIDSQELQAALQRQIAPSDVKLVQVSNSLFLAEEREQGRVSVDPLPEGTASAMTARKLTASVVALLAVIVMCGSVFWLWQRSQISSTSANGTPNEQAPTVIPSKPTRYDAVSPPAVQPTNPLAKADSPVVNATPKEAVPAPVPLASTPSVIPPVQSAPPPVPGKINLSVSAKEDTWVRITVDGKHIVQRVIVQNEPLVLAVANESARILVGNAGSLNVRFNGNDIGLIGPRGQVRTIEFTPGAFNVVQPAPKIAPAPPAENPAAPPA